MKEIVTVVKVEITKIQKVEDNVEITLPTEDSVKEWLKDTLDADDVQVSKVKNFITKE